MPKPGKVHALTATGKRQVYGGDLYAALCGEKVEDASGHEDGAANVKPASAGQKITCRRCRKLAGL